MLAAIESPCLFSSCGMQTKLCSQLGLHCWPTPLCQEDLCIHRSYHPALASQDVLGEDASDGPLARLRPLWDDMTVVP